MRIGIVLSQTPGYSETFFSSKIKGLQQSGHDVVLFVQKRNVDFELCPVRVAPKVYRFWLFQLVAMMGTFLSLVPKAQVVRTFIQLERVEKTGFSSLLKKIYLNAHLLKANVAWLHFGFATQAIGSECVAKAIGAQMAVSFRGFDINVYPVKFPGCYSKLWQYVDKIHSISHYLYKQAVNLGLSKETPFTIIPPAVAIDTLPSNQKSADAITHIITIARLTWIKGLDTAIAAVGHLRSKGLQVHYHIIGEGSTKEYERYAFQVYELGLNDLVHFHGKLSHSETLEKLQDASLYIQPSINEGFCNAVLEAQAMGKLVIASRVGGLSENIVDGQTGWLVAPNDPLALAGKIEAVLALSELEKKRISDHAKHRVSTQFSIKQQQAAFVQFYSES